MKFHKDELIRIKKLEDIHHRASGPGFVYEMRRFTGMKVKIQRCGEKFVTAAGWNWRYEWIEKLEFLSDGDFEL